MDLVRGAKSVSGIDNELFARESVEWQNIWWEQANNFSVKRIALFGDSVTRGFRRKLNERMKGQCVVDLCASSSQITDWLLWKEYKFFLDYSEWMYSKILIQTGGQHGCERKCCDDGEYRKIFKSNYIGLIRKVISYCSDILIVSNTPCVEKNDLREWNYERNQELEERNLIASEAADELKIPYIDIWTPLINVKYEYADCIHMKDEGNDFIAEYLAEYLETDAI